ncbi:unnamed protein product, partial [Prorocentrum cordatum]
GSCEAHRHPGLLRGVVASRAGHRAPGPVPREHPADEAGRPGDHVVKIIDFGAATALRHCGEGECRGKRNYQAPEMHTGGYDAFAADSFALGVVLFATMAHDFPWTSTKAGACKHYSYAQRNGLRALLTARRARKDRPAAV